MLFTTPTGWAMLIVGGAIGGLFAAFSFAICAFSIPMLLDRTVDALTAMGTSMAMVWNNLRAMLVWGAIMLALFVVCLATGLLGLIVVFPLARPRHLARLQGGAVTAAGQRLSADEILLASRLVADGLRQTDLSVPGIQLRRLHLADRGGVRRASRRRAPFRSRSLGWSHP